VASPIDDALRRTADAVAQYQAPERMIAAAARSLAGKPGQARAKMEIDALHDAILAIANDHAGPHDGCDTCHAVRNGLAVAMGIVRAEVDLELEKRIGN
jgi:hypothetical protein